jgi:MFS family permease
MKRVLWLVGAVVLVDTMFFAAVSPLLPHYEEELGLTKTAAGLLTASYPAGTLLGTVPAGWVALRLGVKPAVLAGLALLGVSSVTFGFAEHITLLDVARLIQGVGGAFMWAGGLAWLMAAAPPERRGELIGSALGAAIIGVLFGPVIGGAATVLSPEVVFTAVSVLAVLLAAWAWSTPGVAPEPAGGIGAVLRALRERSVLAGFWLFCLPALFAGVIDVLVPLRLDVLGASGVMVGAIFLVAAAGEAVISPFAGRVSDRLGRLAPIRFGLTGAIAVAILLPLPQTVALVAAALIAAALVLGTFWAPAAALLSDSSEAAGLNQGLAFAVSNLGWALGQLIGGGGGAALADLTDDALPYGLLALICAATLWWVVRVVPRLTAQPAPERV